ncbi:SDR family NAD(P)-dependent oxidoreductase [Natronococcus wangiae]|uniref:SDR family NAD(P)-dependent oxidoreductase n=1 Tax=Natronococcus wangiae TaxID=3068275 RepID=UPI00273DF4C8|nr:SDR family NAD(P)-dependent oxidoreductase [Natronococcus sp. AD5]
MTNRKDTIVLVPGGAGELGAGIVRAFLNGDATVIVPSRSQEHLDDLHTHLESTGITTDRLITLVGNIGQIDGSEALRDTVLERFGRVDTVIASLGGPQPVERLTDVPIEMWDRVIDNFMTAHFVAARTFLPVLTERDGRSYTLINGLSGPTGEIADPAAGLMAVASAGEHMLMRALAENAEQHGESVRINELVPLTPVITRSKTDTDPEWLPAEEFGSVAVALAMDHDHHGKTLGVYSQSDVRRWNVGSGEWTPL